ncbi:DUF3833 domain-containing protein [Histidinibacterium lentulum]|uniref:DUF3833 domain-containing protein n=1 Tax=Histidinibacterium lentulum TaxID=2480588 RepID=A0A3N2R540_9RHOB|nr:DUF3833 domain-containing protein [Histidinibacterium lentulum]ROU02610.1 DUF3833 domain-containing protein [Histidinibacterium lentulum]
MRTGLAVIGLGLLAGCVATPSFDDPQLTGNELELQEFFDGDLRAYGQFQDVLGQVRRQFVVEIAGDWDGETLTLVEDFTYADGATERRVWTLRQTGPETWEGTAPGVIGTAKGEERGDRFNWRYTIDLPIVRAGEPPTTQRVTFDDWMWQLTEDRLFNRAYMYRSGFYIGEVSIMFERLD